MQGIVPRDVCESEWDGGKADGGSEASGNKILCDRSIVTRHMAVEIK